MNVYSASSLSYNALYTIISGEKKTFKAVLNLLLD